MRFALIVGAAGAACLWTAGAQAQVTRSQCLDLLVLSETVRDQTEAAMQGLNRALRDLDEDTSPREDYETNLQALAVVSTWAELTLGLRNRWRELDEELGDLCRDRL